MDDIINERERERQSSIRTSRISDYLNFLAHLIEPPAGRGRGGRRFEVDEQLEFAATFPAHFPLNVERLGVAAKLVPALDAPMASRKIA